MNAGNADLLEGRPDPARLLEHVQSLSKQIGPRPFASVAEEQAGRYIEQALEGFGVQTTRQTFYCKSYEALRCARGTEEGLPPPISHCLEWSEVRKTGGRVLLEGL